MTAVFGSDSVSGSLMRGYDCCVETANAVSMVAEIVIAAWRRRQRHWFRRGEWRVWRGCVWGERQSGIDSDGIFFIEIEGEQWTWEVVDAQATVLDKYRTVAHCRHFFLFFFLFGPASLLLILWLLFNFLVSRL